MEFLTLHQLSREFDKPEKVLRYKFHQLRKQNKLIEGEDFIREDFIDERHFVFKINPVTFFKVASLAPVPLPDTNGYQVDTNTDNNGYQSGTKSVTNMDTKIPEGDANSGNQKENRDTNHARNTSQPNIVIDLVELLKEQLREKDKQLKEKDDQLRSKDDLLKRSQDQARDSQNTQYLALSEIIRLNKQLLPPRADESVINVDPNGYQTPERMDTNTGNQEAEVDTRIDNQQHVVDTNGSQSNTIEKQHGDLNDGQSSQ